MKIFKILTVCVFLISCSSKKFREERLDSLSSKNTTPKLIIIKGPSSEVFPIKETTTREKTMPEDWAEIKIPDSLIELGFSPSHIKQIFF